MLTIRHRTGSLAGTEQTVDEKAERIVFGRDPDVCDVIFPPDERLVARRHFALKRRPSGVWTFDLFGDPYVAVNGEPAEAAQAAHSGDVIELGKRGGPSFELAVSAKEMPNWLAATVAQQRVAGSYATTSQARRLASAGLILAVIVGGAAGGFLYLSHVREMRLDRAVASLAESQARAAAESVSGPVRERLLQASYVVISRESDGEESAVGTASPIGPNLLATNAHVVEIGEDLGRGGKLFVRAPGPGGKSHEVVESRKHPGYEAFKEFHSGDPLVASWVKDCPTCAPSILTRHLSYDVGVLRVADGVTLGPVLDIATPEELANLKPGTPLAMAGYPLEGIAGSEIQHLGATPTLSLGVITALTDIFSLPAEPSQRKLVKHNLPGTGGNSGSPMILPNGKIAALHNAGSFIDVPDVGRVPNAALVRYGQRADMLRDLVAGRADAMLAEDRAYWANQTAAFRRGVEVIVPWILARQKPEGNAAPVLASQNKFRLGRANVSKGPDKDGKEIVRRQKIHQVNLKGGRPVTFIAYARDRAHIGLYLVIDGKIVEQYDGNNWFPEITYRGSEDRAGQVYVIGKNEDVTYTLMEYAWDRPPS